MTGLQCMILPRWCPPNLTAVPIFRDLYLAESRFQPICGASHHCPSTARHALTPVCPSTFRVDDVFLYKAFRRATRQSAP